MAGIYVHIPFCRSKCRYCNFYSVASQKQRGPFLETLKEEILLRRDYLGHSTFETLYLGGGTPSLLTTAEIGSLLNEIHKSLALADDAEITLESNPDDLGPQRLREYLSLGINRLSIGVQSFRDEDLVYLGRKHTARRAEESVAEAKDAGFSNISIDLIYGIPSLPDDQWMYNLDRAFSFETPHISAYSLTVETKTPLDLLIRKNQLAGLEEERVLEHFRILSQRMRENGFEHYEISNFCKKGFHSRHNSLYWTGSHYLGLGPSAHSYDGHSRQWNRTDLSGYMDQIREKDRFHEMEELTPVQKYNEYVMVSLRTMWGCSLMKIMKESGNEASSWFTEHVARFLESGHVIEKEGVYSLTDEGKLFADGIAAELFMEEK